MSRRKSAQISIVAAETQTYDREALNKFLASVSSYCKYDTDRNTMSLIARRETIDARIKELEGVRVEIQNAFKSSLDILRTCRHPNFTKTLDDDVLLRVFKHAGGFGADERTTISISHTCSRWRKLALGMPVLWTSINCTSLSLALMDHYTSNSADHPVDVEIDLEDVFRCKKCESVLPRMRSLSVRQCTLKNLEDAGWLYDQPAPELQRVSLLCAPCDDPKKLLTWRDGHLFTDPLFAGQSPKLRELELEGCRLSWESGMYRSLTRLTISVSHAYEDWYPCGPPDVDVLHVFRDSPNLEEVALHSPDEVPVGQPPADALIPMRRLRRLHLSLQSTPMHAILSAIATPPCLRLSLSCVIVQSTPAGKRCIKLPRDVRCLPCLEEICKLEVNTLAESIVGFLPDGGEPVFTASVVSRAKAAYYVPEKTVTATFSAMRGLPLHGLKELFIRDHLVKGLSSSLNVGMFLWDTATHVRTLTLSRSSATAFTGIARQYKDQVRAYCPNLVSISLDNMFFESGELLDACEVLARADRTLSLTKIRLDRTVQGDVEAKQPGADALEKIRKLNYANVFIADTTWGFDGRPLQ